MNQSLISLIGRDGDPAGGGCWIGDRWILTSARAVNRALGRSADYSQVPNSVIILEFPSVNPSTRLRAKVSGWSDPIILDAALLELLDAPAAHLHPARPLVYDSLWAHAVTVSVISAQADLWIDGILGEQNSAGYCPLLQRDRKDPVILPGLRGMPVWNEQQTDLVGILVDEPITGNGCVQVLSLKALLPIFPQVNSLVIYPSYGLQLELYRLRNQPDQTQKGFVKGNIFDKAKAILDKNNFLLLAGAPGTGRHTLAHALMQHYENAFVFPHTVPWSEIVETGVSGAGMVVELAPFVYVGDSQENITRQEMWGVNTIYSHGDGPSQGEHQTFDLLNQLLARGNHIVLVAAQAEQKLIEILTPSLNKFLEEQYKPHRALDLDEHSYEISEKVKIIAGCMESKFRNGAITRGTYNLGSEFLEDMLDSGAGTQNQSTSNQDRENVKDILSRWTPGEINQWMDEQLSLCDSPTDIKRTIKQEIRKGDSNWLLGKDISIQILLLAVCIFEGQSTTQFWAGYQEIVHSLRGINLNLAILTLELARTHLPGVLLPGNFVHFSSPYARRVIQEAIGRSHKQILLELMPLLGQWTLGNPGQSGYLESLLVEQRFNQVDEQVLSTLAARTNVSELVAIAASQNVASFRELIESWAGSPDTRVAWAAEKTWKGIARRNLAVAIDLLNEWCNFHPDLIYIQVTAIRILSGLVSSNSPDWVNQYAIRQLSGFAASENQKLITELIKITSGAEFHLALIDLMPVITRLAQNDNHQLRVAKSQILIIFSNQDPDQTFPFLKRWSASYESGFRWIAIYVFCACWESFKDRWQIELEAGIKHSPYLILDVLSAGLANYQARPAFLAVIHQLINPTMGSGRPNSNTSVFIEALANMMQTSRGIVKHLHDQLLALDVSLANQMNTRVTQRIIDRQAEQYVMAWQAAITAETDRDPYDLLRVMKNTLLEPGQSPALLKACKEMAVLGEEGNRNLATIRIIRACALDPEVLELLKGLVAGQGDPLLAWLDSLVQGYDALVIQQRKEFSQALTTNPERALKIVETAFSLPAKRFIIRDAIRAMLADKSHKKAEQLSRVLLDQPNLPGHLTQWREMADQDKPVDELLKVNLPSNPPICWSGISVLCKTFEHGWSGVVGSARASVSGRQVCSGGVQGSRRIRRGIAWRIPAFCK